MYDLLVIIWLTSVASLIFMIIFGLYRLLLYDLENIFKDIVWLLYPKCVCSSYRRPEGWNISGDLDDLLYSRTFIRLKRKGYVLIYYYSGYRWRQITLDDLNNWTDEEAVIDRHWILREK